MKRPRDKYGIWLEQVEQRVVELRTRYVHGDITLKEFEHKIDNIMLFRVRLDLHEARYENAELRQKLDRRIVPVI